MGNERFNFDAAIGFTESKISLLPTTLGQINPAYFNQVAAFVAATGGSVRSYYGFRLVDSLRVDVGTMPQKDWLFFAQGQNAQGALFIAGTNFTKGEIDTTLQDNGKLPLEYDYLIWGMGVEFLTSGVIPFSVQPSGKDYVGLTLDPGNESNNAGPASVINQTNLVTAFQESLYFEFFINNAIFENGTSDFFPSGPYGISSGFAVDGNNFLSEGRANNGFGVGYCTPILRYLPAQTRFGVRMKNKNPFINNRPTVIRWWFEGLMAGPVTA